MDARFNADADPFMHVCPFFAEIHGSGLMFFFIRGGLSYLPQLCMLHVTTEKKLEERRYNIQRHINLL